MASLLQYLTVLLSATAIVAWPQYIDQVPNALGCGDGLGESVPWTIAIGHYCVNGGGPLSPFGWDFAHNNHYWNLCLACADSDNDGFPNGWELGDPCGYWSTHSKAVPCWKDDISHPGNASSVPLTRTVDWLGTCGYNPCENSDIVQCVAYLDTQRPHHGIQMNLHLQDKESSSTTTTTALRGNNGESVSSSSLLKNIHQHQPEQTKSSLSPDIVTIQNHQLTLLEEIQGQEQSSVHTDTSILAHDPPPQPKCGRYNPRPSHQP